MSFTKKHAIRDLKAPQVAQDIDDNFDAIFKALRVLLASSEASSLEGTTSEPSIGVMGPPGIEGEDGEPGLMGPPGSTGPVGATGAAGTPGNQGLDRVVESGETRTIADTYSAVAIDYFAVEGTGVLAIEGDGVLGIISAGTIGLLGPTGAPGPMGLMGLDGEDGMDGWPGPAGPAGASGSATQDWEGKIVACFGDGDPNVILTAIQQGVAAATPTNISTSIARLSYFKLRTAITVANIRWYGVGSLTAVYHIAIYRASDDVRISADNNPDTVADSWNAVADSFTLDANTLYYAAVSVDTTGVTAGIVTFGGNLNNTAGAIKVLPTSWPGNLLVTSNYVNSAWIGQAAVTTGVLPNPGNAPTVIGTWTGGMPAIFLDAA